MAKRNSQTFVTVITLSSKKAAQEYALLLSSQGIDNSLTKIKDTESNHSADLPGSAPCWKLCVAEESLDKAQNEIKLYNLQEDDSEVTQADFEPKVRVIGGDLISIAILLLALAFFFVEQSSLASINFKSLGRASSELILQGEYYRTVTALTLHVNIKHILSNMVWGAIFVAILARLIGYSASWLIFLITGSLGNYATALLYQTNHNAVGASTGVFGLIGVLTGLNVLHRFYNRKHSYALIPLASGAALLAILGTGKSDIFAHLFGFISGLFTSLLFYFFAYKTKFNETPFATFLFPLVSLLILLGSWACAIF